MRESRRVALVGVVAIGLAVAASSGNTAGGCRTEDKGNDGEAVFGHYAKLAPAQQLRARLVRLGFKQTVVENDGCGDYEVEQPGLNSPKQRADFVREVVGAKLQVAFESPGAEPSIPGTFEAVFGSFPTLGQANALMLKAAAKGFRLIDIERDGPGDWEVVVYGVPLDKSEEFAQEAQTAGFKIQYEIG